MPIILWSSFSQHSMLHDSMSSILTDAFIKIRAFLASFVSCHSQYEVSLPVPDLSQLTLYWEWGIWSAYIKNNCEDRHAWSFRIWDKFNTPLIIILFPSAFKNNALYSEPGTSCDYEWDTSGRIANIRVVPGPDYETLFSTALGNKIILSGIFDLYHIPNLLMPVKDTHQISLLST